MWIKLSNIIHVLAWSIFLAKIATISLAQTDNEAVRQPIAVESPILKTIESTAVASQVAGMIQVLDVREGKAVALGQELGRIRDTAVRLQMEKAKLSLELARKRQASDIDQRLASKNLAVAENEYLRALEANRKVSNVYPLNEIDRLKLIFDRTALEFERTKYQAEVAEMERSIADVEHRQSEELVQRHQILSPCNGIVTSVEKHVGEWVDPGSVLFTIVQMDRLRIEGFIQALDAKPQLVGSKASIRVENSEIERMAELVFISPEANPVNSQVRIFLEVDNSDGALRPGMRPTVSLDRLP